MHRMKFFGTVVAVTLLAGCASWDVDGVASMSPQGDAFTQALHKHYVERAKFEVGEHDWSSVEFFTARARMAAMGETPAPQDVAERHIAGDAVGEIAAARSQLVAALGTSAPQDNPDACALAQTWLEHWMEQQEEGHQPDHIAMTKDGFMQAMPNCKAAMAAAPAQPAAPSARAFVVYFDFNDATLNADALAVVEDAAGAIKKAEPEKVSITGHTDTSGNAEYNEALSAARAAIVSGKLMQLGVDGGVIDVNRYGEGRTAVPTGDGVKEARNRRVEIFFIK